MGAKKTGAIWPIEGIRNPSEPRATGGRSAQAIAKTSRLGRAVLRSVTSDVVAEYLAGKWPGLNNARGSQLRALLLEELLSRCPGFSTREYRVALTVRLVARGVMRKVRHARGGSRLDGR
jgi:hypothetical protein